CVVHHSLPSHSWQYTTGEVFHRREVIITEPDSRSIIASIAHEPSITIALGCSGFATHPCHGQCRTSRCPSLADSDQHLVHILSRLLGHDPVWFRPIAIIVP